MQLLIARYVGLPCASRSSSATVHAPQSPSAQPHLLPVRPKRRSQSSNVVVAAIFSTNTRSPFRVNSNASVCAALNVAAERLLMRQIYPHPARRQPKHQSPSPLRLFHLLSEKSFPLTI